MTIKLSNDVLMKYHDEYDDIYDKIESYIELYGKLPENIGLRHDQIPSDCKETMTINYYGVEIPIDEEYVC